MVIVVVEPNGALVFSEKMDGAQYGSNDVARRKAETSASFRRPTAYFQEAVKGGTLNAIFTGALAIEGGELLIVDGKIAGAIGASGGSGASGRLRVAGRGGGAEVALHDRGRAHAPVPSQGSASANSRANIASVLVVLVARLGATSRPIAALKVIGAEPEAVTTLPSAHRPGRVDISLDPRIVRRVAGQPVGAVRGVGLAGQQPARGPRRPSRRRSPHDLAVGMHLAQQAVERRRRDSRARRPSRSAGRRRRPPAPDR